ncbi:MAG: MFS transporter, partial [Chloroflexi bacterium]|nr:MFS transporter [Chloroflexota bacterium]
MAIETASPAASAPASRNETMTVAALTGTAVMMTTALLLPSPLLVELSRSFDVPVSVAGQLTTIAAIPWGFGGLIMGPLSDRFGRRRMLLAGVAL